jgi:hypothetical protein
MGILKRGFTFFCLLVLLAEPFSQVLASAKPGKNQVCSTCGMKNTCGDVCCCTHSKKSRIDTGRSTCLYAPGCLPDGSKSSFVSSSLAKWIPTKTSFFSLVVKIESIDFSNLVSSFHSDILSPPPEGTVSTRS